MTEPVAYSPVSLLDQFELAFRLKSLVRLVLSAPDRKSASDISRYTVRSVQLKDGMHLQWTSRSGTQERHENLSLKASLARITEFFPRVFREGNLLTSERDYQFRSRDGQTVQASEKPGQRSAPAVEHNRGKHYLIPEGQPCPFLEAIGVMTPEGRVRASMAHKFHQINRFLELVQDIVPQLPPDGTLRVVDFGSGKSYLTFALHHLLTQIHHRTVQILAIDQNAGILETCSGLCDRLDISGIEFRAAAIGAVELSETVDLAVALHACDTATDEALAQAVRWQAKVILAVPCCQHQIAQSVDSKAMQLILKHGILKERFAALATDALRAEALDCAGYRTQVVEFVDLDHTPKNLLLRAVRRKFPVADQRIAYSQLKSALGLSEIASDRIGR